MKGENINSLMDGMMIINLLGGLGLFLYGMKLMGDGLEDAAGEKLKGILEKITQNRVVGAIVGAIVTCVIQSSSATTVMVISFVNAGLMNLMQAAGVIMGANVGTTVTAQLVAFKFEGFAPLCIGIGAIALIALKKKRSKDVASIILGFGILFLGMELMSTAMKPLAQSDLFKDIITIIGDNIFLGLILGIIATAVIQSSSATTGILIALASTGSIDIRTAIPIILGCNIGTCITAALAAISGNKTAKKTALIHVMFNLIGVIITLPFIGVLANIVSSIDSDVSRNIANVHTIFNVGVTLILLPLTPYLIKIIDKLVPGQDEIEKDGPIYLDKNLLETPIVATGQVFKETLRMGELAKNNLEASMKGFLEDNAECIEFVYKNEKIINTLEKEITNYLVLLSAHELPDEDSKILSATFHVINDIERIGDHAKNIVELATSKIEQELSIGSEAKVEITGMYNKAFEAVNLSLECYANKDISGAINVEEIEKTIDNYAKKLRDNNIERLNKKVCLANISAIYLDIISNLERIGDHATNIAEAVYK